MSERFAPGDQVRTRHIDPAHHTRLPRYARGAVGTVVSHSGQYPVPDDRARGLATDAESVYAVRFAAQESFGAGDHSVTLDLCERYLSPAHGAAHETGVE